MYITNAVRWVSSNSQHTHKYSFFCLYCTRARNKQKQEKTFWKTIKSHVFAQALITDRAHSIKTKKDTIAKMSKKKN